MNNLVPLSCHTHVGSYVGESRNAGQIFKRICNFDICYKTYKLMLFLTKKKQVVFNSNLLQLYENREHQCYMYVVVR